jgi:hypothetical protein
MAPQLTPGDREPDNAVDRVPPPSPPDHGFRRMAIWTLLAFLFAAVVSLAAVTLVIHWFDKG